MEKCLLEGSGFSVTISPTYFQTAQLNVNQHQIQVNKGREVTLFLLQLFSTCEDAHDKIVLVI